MLRLTIISILIAVATAKTPKVRPNVSTFNGRIVGGETANIKDFPYQLSLRNDGIHVCGASILSATRALTAAHCTHGKKASALSVRAGSRCRSGTVQECHKDPISQEVNVLSICDHPEYDDDTVDNDVSVLLLASPLTFGSLVQPISILGSPLATGTLATVSGWGRLAIDDGPSDVLMKVQVPRVSQADCEAAYGPSVITKNMVCFGLKAGGKDSCEFDSGGPLVYNGKQVGIVSWGDGCGAPGYPGIYADLSVTHIKEHINSC